MPDFPVHVQFPGRLVFVGFGSIGQGVLPLVLRHIGIKPERITIVTADEAGKREAAEYGIKFVVNPLTRDNYRQVLEPLIGRGDFLLNLSVDVSSIALIKFAHEKGALYLDTCIEPWPGGYTDPSISPSRRTNYALREEALALRQSHKNGPTAVLTHGANPGLVSHFVKQALLNLASDSGVDAGNPSTREQWAALAAKLQVKVIHIAERDTQVANVPKRPERVRQHLVGRRLRQRRLPAGRARLGHAREGRCRRAASATISARRARSIMLQPGAATRVRTWTPKAGPFHGFLITHGEVDLDSRLPDASRGRQGRVPADRALRLSPVQRRGALGARVRRAQLAPAGAQADSQPGDHRRHRRARRAARRPQEERVLVRLAAVDRGGAQARAAQHGHQPAGLRRGAVGHGVGDGEPAGAA